MNKPTKTQIAKTYSELKSVRKAANKLGISKDKVWRTIRELDYQNLPSGQTEFIDENTMRIESKLVSNLDELLESAGVDAEEWVVVNHRVNAWQALGKDSEIIQLKQVKAHLERAPSFFVQPVEPVEPMPRVPRERTSDVRCALIVPDIQAGFRRIEDNKSPGGYRWVPLHDRKAMNAVLQIAEAYSHQIDTVVHLGDHLDLAPWSTRWTSDSSLKYTSNAALRELYAGFLVPLREILPHAHMVYMEGNHEKRIEDALASKLGEASTLRTADTLDGHSLLSIPSLLALDSIDVEYIAPYGKVWWLYDQIRISHGSVARRGGGNTAAEYLKRATSSAIWGHTHRLEMAQKRLTTPKGIEIITAASPGCLCRSEIGVVPGVLGNPPDWQQGVGLVYESNGKHSMHMIPIVDGVAIFNGEVFEGEDIPEEWAERTGLPF